MREVMHAIKKFLTHWWDEDEANRKNEHTDEVVRRAHSAASDAQSVIASYRAASKIAGRR